MISATMLDIRPEFMHKWPTAYPRRWGHWTVVSPDDNWAALDPETGTISVVDPRQDPKLAALASVLQRGTLIGYRIGRRAIVATPDSFIKVLRPRRVQALIDTHRALAISCPALSFPHILVSDPAGSVELARVPGIALHQLLRSAPRPALDSALDRIGSALAVFHSTTPPSKLAVRSLDDPARWLETVRRLEPDAGADLARVAGGLPALQPVGHTVVHGDLHDKNIFASPSGAGLIDLDGVGLGAAEDDVANLAVHLKLRALQAGHLASVGTDHAERLYTAYQSVRTLDLERCNAVERQTWFRLACLYRFRAASRDLTPELLRRATRHQR